MTKGFGTLLRFMINIKYMNDLALVGIDDIKRLSDGFSL